LGQYGQYSVFSEYSCERAAASIVPQTEVLGSEEAAKNATWLLISDLFPINASLVSFSIDFPSAPRANEEVAVSCTVPTTLSDRVFFSAETYSGVMTASNFVTNTGKLRFSLYSLSSSSSSSGASIIRDTVKCNLVSSIQGTTNSIPIYDKQVLSVGIIWMRTSWPQFNDMIIEGSREGSYRSIWGPPGEWNYLTSRDGVSRRLTHMHSSKGKALSRRTASWSERNDTASLDALDELDFLVFIGQAFRTPSEGQEASLVFTSNSNITLLSAGLWMTGSDGKSADASSRTVGPFQKGLNITFGGMPCSIRRLSPDGHAVRLSLPSFQAICSTSLSRDCINPQLSIATPRGIDATSLHLLALGGSESSSEEVRLMASSAGLPASLSFPPFTPSAKGQEFVYHTR
jgi:hypothetical protein